MQNNKLIPMSIVILTLGIMLSSILLGYSIQKLSNVQTKNTIGDNNVLTISQAANYLGMTEEVLGIIKIEKKILESSGSYTGMMFPYFTVNDKLYFYKEQIDEWMKEVSNLRREYDTKSGFVL